MAMIKCPECGERISSKAAACPHCGISRRTNDALKQNIALCFEYRSKKELFGWPLVHIVLGPAVDPTTGRLRVAKGIIAVGGIAIGVVTLGGVGLGVFSFGGAAVGVTAAGGAAIGLLLGIGGAAMGFIAIGGATLGYYVYGGAECGVKLLGGQSAVVPLLSYVKQSVLVGARNCLRYLGIG